MMNSLEEQPLKARNGNGVEALIDALEKENTTPLLDIQEEPGRDLAGDDIDNQPLYAKMEGFEEMIQREMEKESSSLNYECNQEKKTFLKRSEVDSKSLVECDKCKKKFKGSFLSFHTKRCSGGKTFRQRAIECVADQFGYDDRSVFLEKKAMTESEVKPNTWKKQHEQLQSLLKSCKPKKLTEQPVQSVQPKSKHPSSHTLKPVTITETCPKCNKKIGSIGFNFHVRRCCKYDPKKLLDERTYCKLEIAIMNAPIPRRANKSAIVKKPKNRETLKSLIELDRKRYQLSGKSSFSTITIHQCLKRQLIVKKYSFQQ